MRGRDLALGRRARNDNIESVAGECAGHGGGERPRREWHAIEAVTGRRSQQQLQHPTRRYEPGNACGNPRIAADAAAQERSPWELHGDARRAVAELGRRRFCRGEDEAGIRQTALAGRPGRTARRFGHGGGDRVQAEREGSRFPGGGGEDGSAVARPDVHRHPLVAGNEIGNLADVHLEEAAANDELDHGRQDTLAAQQAPRVVGSGTEIR